MEEDVLVLEIDVDFIEYMIGKKLLLGGILGFDFSDFK